MLFLYSNKPLGVYGVIAPFVNLYLIITLGEVYVILLPVISELIKGRDCVVWLLFCVKELSLFVILDVFPTNILNVPNNVKLGIYV